MPLNATLRKAFLRRYLVYRVKAIEFFDLSAVRQGLLAHKITVPTPVGRTNDDFVAGLRTVLLSWMALFIDKSKDGMDVLEARAGQLQIPVRRRRAIAESLYALLPLLLASRRRNEPLHSTDQDRRGRLSRQWLLRFYIGYRCLVGE